MPEMSMREVYELVGREYPAELYGDIAVRTDSTSYAQDHRYAAPVQDTSKPITGIEDVYAFLGMRFPSGVYDTTATTRAVTTPSYDFSNVYDRKEVERMTRDIGGKAPRAPLPDTIFGIQLRWIMLGLAALIVIAAVK